VVIFARGFVVGIRVGDVVIRGLVVFFTGFVCFFLSDAAAAPSSKEIKKKINTNGARTKIHDIVLYPALQIRFKTHVQNTT
jgi:hypothetical protein